MPNASDNDTLVEMGPDAFAVCVGIGYIFTGVIFIFLQLICAYLIMIHKKMKNPTYKLVINMSVCDAITLVPICLYCGITLLLDTEHPTVSHWMAAVALAGWYSNCLLFAYIAFSRWIAITRPELVSLYFRANVMKFLHGSSWLIPVLASVYVCVIANPPLFIHFRPVFSWGYDTSTHIGEILHWYNFSNDAFVSTVEMTFNVMSLYYVRKTRNQVQTLAASKNRRREVKLLIQSFIMGTIFAAVNITFNLATVLGLTSRVAVLYIQFTWTLNHCVNPLVYLSLNTELRKTFLKFMTRGKCCEQNNTTGPHGSNTAGQSAQRSVSKRGTGAGANVVQPS